MAFGKHLLCSISRPVVWPRPTGFRSEIMLFRRQGPETNARWGGVLCLRGTSAISADYREYLHQARPSYRNKHGRLAPVPEWCLCCWAMRRNVLNFSVVSVTRHTSVCVCDGLWLFPTLWLISKLFCVLPVIIFSSVYLKHYTLPSLVTLCAVSLRNFLSFRSALSNAQFIAIYK